MCSSPFIHLWHIGIKYTKSMGNDVDILGQIIWDYMKLDQPLQQCDAILALGSRDDRVAKYAASLFLQGLGRKLIISGGSAHQNDLLATKWIEPTEAEHFQAVAVHAGVPIDQILLEKRATNTGENIKFTSDLLRKNRLDVNSIVVVTKPYMERRAFATFAKQWPDANTRFMVACPPISYADYFNDLQPKEQIINIMVGDLQRIHEYPKLGFQTEQSIPGPVWGAYEQLVRLGYDKHLMKVTQ